MERCYICLENLVDDVNGFTSSNSCNDNNNNNNNNLKCGCFNRYHIHCLDTWLSIKNKCPICKKKINETEEDEFELEVDDNDIFYNPLLYFITVYFIYFIVLFSINHFIYIYFLE